VLAIPHNTNFDWGVALAMVAVGIWGAQLGKPAIRRWLSGW
jgi:hypothetical protein